MMVALTLLCASLTACAGATKPNQQQQTVSQPPTAEAQPEDNAGSVGIESPDNSRAEKDKKAREELYPEKEPDPTSVSNLRTTAELKKTRKLGKSWNVSRKKPKGSAKKRSASRKNRHTLETALIS